MISTNPELSPREAEAVVARRLAQITPREQPVRIAGALPLAVLLGGPPASGKTTNQGLVQMSLGADRVAVYDFDDDAAAHPRYDAIMRARGIRGHEAVAQSLPLNLRFRCLEHLRGGDPKYDVVASAPLHLEDGTKIWVDGFRAQGYRVALVYVTTNEANSLLGIANRYQQARDDTGISRWVAPVLHDRTYRGVPDTAHALESLGYVDDIYVVNRDGQVLFENHRNPDGSMQHPAGAREAILGERNRPPTPAEREHFLAVGGRLRQRDPALPALEEPVADAVREAFMREALRPEPQEGLWVPSPAGGLDHRLADLQRITGSGVAPAHSMIPPTSSPSGPASARGSNGGRSGLSPDGGSRDR
jgi:hypothetical protein